MQVNLPGDKSISHRMILFASMAEGLTSLSNLNPGEDVAATRQIFSRFGVTFTDSENVVNIVSHGIKHWHEPGSEPLNCKNSGTTARLLTGLFAGIPFRVTLEGDASLSKRPMKRIIIPLESMGAHIQSQTDTLPLTIDGRPLRPIHYRLPVASAQLKSALILAASSAHGKSIIEEPFLTRDHTERIGKAMGMKIFRKDRRISVRPFDRLFPATAFSIPGDPSAAAFWIAAALISNNSRVVIPNCSLNPTRIRYIQILKNAGAHIHIFPQQTSGEPRGMIIAASSQLKAFTIHKLDVPLLIDEVPVLALIASQAKGTSIFHHLKELTIKESDRLTAITENLSTAGIQIQQTQYSLVIPGNQTILGGLAHSGGDHRIAMMMAVAGLASKEGVDIDDPRAANISDPLFFPQLNDIH